MFDNIYDMDWLVLLEEIETFHKKLTYFKLIKHIFSQGSIFERFELIFYFFIALGYAAVMFYYDKSTYFICFAIFWILFMWLFQEKIENDYKDLKNKSPYMWKRYLWKYIRYSDFKEFLDQKNVNKEILKNICEFLEKEKLYVSFKFAILNRPIVGIALTIILSIIIALFMDTAKGKIIISTVGFVGALFLIMFFPSLIILKIRNGRYIELMQFIHWYLKGI